jgi:hypothetical protein
LFAEILPRWGAAMLRPLQHRAWGGKRLGRA